MKAKAIFFTIILILWILLNLPLNTQNFILGVLVSALATYFVRDFYKEGAYIFFHITRYFWLLIYIPIFIWQCFKANLDVVYRVAHPKKPINPGIVKVDTDLKSDTALTFLANSITLTPGTLTVDVDKENKVLYVHWINVKSTDRKEATKMVVGRFENILERIFER